MVDDCLRHLFRWQSFSSVVCVVFLIQLRESLWILSGEKINRKRIWRKHLVGQKIEQNFCFKIFWSIQNASLTSFVFISSEASKVINIWGHWLDWVFFFLKPKQSQQHNVSSQQHLIWVVLRTNYSINLLRKSLYRRYLFEQLLQWKRLVWRTTYHSSICFVRMNVSLKNVRTRVILSLSTWLTLPLNQQHSVHKNGERVWKLCY